ncbi:MAG: M12 family metallo-peptidase [Rudaea sp.]
MLQHRVGWRAIVGLSLGLAGGLASAQTSLFVPVQPADAARSSTSAGTTQTLPGVGKSQRLVAINATAMQAMSAGDEVLIVAPNDASYTAIYDRTEAAYGGGKVWVGHLANYTDEYAVILSTFEGEVSGIIHVPGGKLRLDGPQKQALLTDTLAAGETALRPTRDDIVRAPHDPLAAIADELGIPAASAAPAASGTNSQIDLLFLYSPGLLTARGNVPAIVSRANALVTLANQIYTNSGMSLTLNLVSVQPDSAAYADSDDNTALSGVTNDTTIQALRNQYGADLVTLIRPFVGSVCGLAWIPGSMSQSNLGYSVVEDGSSGSFFCDDSSMTHELGHNMGAAHDAGTSATYSGLSSLNGTPSYNRGYCNGNGGTIMAYFDSKLGCSPMHLMFSTPALNSCGGACGKASTTAYTFTYFADSSETGTAMTASATGADSVSAINTNAVSIAAWRAAGVAATKFVPLTPARLLDTRAGFATIDGLFAGGGAVGPGAQLSLTVAGRGGVPASNVGSVVLTVTATAPTAAAFVTAWPSGSARPNASNLNFTAGQTISNLVIAKVGTGGAVSLFNSTGSTSLIADVTGWFPTTSGFTALTPARLLDTRAGTTTVDGQFQAIGTPPTGSETDLTVVGRGGVPATGVRAVVLNVTVAGAGGPGYITAWPAGTARPFVSNLNYPTNTIIPNLVVAGVGSNGKVALFNSAGTDIIADVAGSFSTSSELTLVGPARLLDTRAGTTTVDGQFQGAGALGGGGSLDLTVTNRAGIPASGVGAVVLNVTAVTPTAAGYFTVWPTGTARPNASNVNFTAHQIISTLVFAKVGSSGKVSIYNAAGFTDVIADVVGWLPVSP